jgi:hypothetical protein
MPNVTDVDAFTDPIDFPADGDAATSASILSFLQDVANRTRYILNRAITKNTGTVAIPIIAGTASTNAGFIQGDDGENADASGSISQNSIAGAPEYMFAVLGMPRFGTLVRMRVGFAGRSSGGVRAGLPGTMPIFKLYRQVKSGGGGRTEVISVTDPSGSVGVYEANHDVVSSDVAIALAPGQLWFFRVYGETGANEQVGAAVYWLEVDVTP